MASVSRKTLCQLSDIARSRTGCPRTLVTVREWEGSSLRRATSPIPPSYCGGSAPTKARAPPRNCNLVPAAPRPGSRRPCHASDPLPVPRPSQARSRLERWSTRSMGRLGPPSRDRCPFGILIAPVNSRTATKVRGGASSLRRCQQRLERMLTRRNPPQRIPNRGPLHVPASPPDDRDTWRTFSSFSNAVSNKTHSIP